MKMSKKTLKRLQKIFNFFVVLMLLVQPVGAPSMLVAYADDGEATVSSEAPAPVAQEEEVATPAEETPAPAETPVVEEAVAPIVEAETPVIETTETPVLDEAPVVVEQPNKEENNSEEGAKKDEEKNETPVVEEPVVETGANLLVDATNEMLGTTENTGGILETLSTWAVDGNKATTNSPVELGKKYEFPGNKDVSVTFTALPENPGTLSIEEITLSAEQVATLGALSDKAYDITSTMENGTFEYDLTLPNAGKENVQISYIEKSAEELNEVESEDIKTIDQDKIDVEKDKIEVNDINHFTIFFSEYIESPSNNKALEIYNNTNLSIDLASNACRIEMYFNGSASAGLMINLTGTIAAGDVYVVAHASASNATILAQADQLAGGGWFNGDDAVVLKCGGAILDVIGQIGSDPGTEWGSGVTSTADNTLVRKFSITTGDVNGYDAFDPSIEWTGYPVNTSSYLGSTIICGNGALDLGEQCDDNNIMGGDGCSATCQTEIVDLTVAKTNNLNENPAMVGNSFNWIINITNSGNVATTFSSGQIIVRDNMPSNGLNVAYGIASVNKGNGTTGNINCSQSGINRRDLSCSASGLVVIPAGGTIEILVPVNPTILAAGSTLTNPRSGSGLICKVDPNNNISESSDANNTCLNSVSVVIPGSIDVFKFNDKNGNGNWNLGEPGINGWQMNLYAGSGCTGSLISQENTHGLYNADFYNLVPGSYSVNEERKDGWIATTSDCINTTISSGEHEHIYFGNQETGHLLVQKTTNPASDPAQFPITATGSGTIIGGGAGTISDSTDKNYEVAPGTYSVTEAVLEDWNEPENNCQNIVVRSGETKYCTITNTKKGKIIIEKQTLPDGSQQSFDFDASYGSQNGEKEAMNNDSSFSLKDGETNDSGWLSSNTNYSVSERALEGWDLTDVTCVSDMNAPREDNQEQSSLLEVPDKISVDNISPDNIYLNPGETVTCTFTNTQRGKITIIKTTQRDTNRLFPFTTDFAGAFSLGQNGVWTSEFLKPETYTVSEGSLDDEHWGFQSLNCVDSAQSATFVQNKKAVAIDLAPGSNVVCTYYNDYSSNDSGGGGEGNNNNPVVLTTGGGGATGGNAQGGTVEGENAENNPEGAGSEGGNVLGEATQQCQSWPLWVWIMLIVIFAGGFNYAAGNYRKGAGEIKWFWPVVWVVGGLAVWYFYDNCRWYRWFPYATLILAAISYGYYLLKLKKSTVKN